MATHPSRKQTYTKFWNMHGHSHFTSQLRLQNYKRELQKGFHANPKLFQTTQMCSTYQTCPSSSQARRIWRKFVLAWTSVKNVFSLTPTLACATPTFRKLRYYRLHITKRVPASRNRLNASMKSHWELGTFRVSMDKNEDHRLYIGHASTDRSEASLQKTDQSKRRYLGAMVVSRGVSKRYWFRIA